MSLAEHPTMFIKFRDLPTELQTKIWKCAAFNAMQIWVLEVSIGPYSNIQAEPRSREIVEYCRYVYKHADLKGFKGYTTNSQVVYQTPNVTWLPFNLRKVRIPSISCYFDQFLNGSAEFDKQCSLEFLQIFYFSRSTPNLSTSLLCTNKRLPRHSWSVSSMKQNIR